MLSLLMVATMLIVYGGLMIATLLQRPPRPPVVLAAARWQQFTDSCVGTFVVRSVVAHSLTLELAVTDVRGGTEITPEEHVDRLGVGQAVHFTVYETPCREIVAWHVREQSHHLRDDPVYPERPSDD